MIETLVFLTDRFPFGTGEDFIANEIEYMKMACKRIFVVPVNARDYTSCRISEDEKVHIWRGNFRVSKIKRVINAPMLFFDKNVKDDYKFLQTHGNLNISTLELLLYFTEEYNRTTRNVADWISSQIDSNAEITIYSYWLYNTAYVACKLRSQLNVKKTVSRGHGFDIYLERNRNNYLPHRNFIIDNLDYILPISDNGSCKGS